MRRRASGAVHGGEGRELLEGVADEGRNDAQGRNVQALGESIERLDDRAQVVEALCELGDLRVVRLLFGIARRIGE